VVRLMDSSIFEIDAFAEIAAQECSRTSLIVAAAAQQCAMQQRGARRARRDDICRAFAKAWRPDLQLTADDFEAFRLSWIAEYRALGGECAEPETFFATLTAARAA
jgi:hypothetical protein